jgi:DNA-binding PadR family transcriptional regulator
MYASELPAFTERTASQIWVWLRRFRSRRLDAYPRPVKSAPPLSYSNLMQPRDRLLLFIALDGAPQGLDPIRLQKGMFLFAMDDSSGVDEVYDFVPYDYGPMSTQIYRDLDDLAERGLIAATPVEGQTWSRYSATEDGLVAARDLLEQEPSQEAARLLFEIKDDVASHTFQQVLEDVYDRYPEFASKSVFRRAS